MDEFYMTKAITELADGEIKDAVLREELKAKINNDRDLSFQFQVQSIISRTLKDSLIKRPVSYSFRRKLIELIDTGKRR
jgi:hypothetical protein